MKRIWRSRVSGFLLIFALLLLWEVSSRSGFVDSPSWPPVSKIVTEWAAIAVDGSLIGHILATLWRMGLGYAIGIVLGVSLGLAMGYFRPVYSLLEPLVELLRPIPGPAYLPVLILFVGIGNSMKIVLIALAAFFPIVLNTLGGVRGIDPVQVQTARTFGLTDGQMMREVMIPAAAPQIFTGLRIALAISLILAILSEMVAANDGLGFLILNSERSFQVERMYAGIFTLAVVGYLMNRLFLLAEARLIRWHFNSTRDQLL